MHEEHQQPERKLCCLVGQPWLARKLFGSVQSDIEDWVAAIHSYNEYFQWQTLAVQTVHQQSEPQ